MRELYNEETTKISFRTALPEDYPLVRDFYYRLTDDLHISGYGYDAGWVKDVYPDRQLLEENLAAGTLTVVETAGEIAAAMILNHSYNESYEDYNGWTPAAPEEILSLHALGVLPKYARRGIARQMVRYAVESARCQGGKVLRLDVLAGNVPAEKLYPSEGFRCLITIPMFYEDTGWTDYRLYELIL